MKILILNQHSQNLGDEAAGTAVVKNLLRVNGIEKIEILYCKDNNLTVDSDKVIHNHSLSAKQLTKKDYLKYIITGKTNNQFLKKFTKIIDEYDRIILSPCGANLGIYYDWQLLLQVFTVVHRRKKLLFHLNTIGKSGRWWFDKLVLYVCRRSKVYVREQKSFDYLNKKGIAVKFGTDSAFSLKSLEEFVDKKNHLVFVPSNIWGWHPSFRNKKDDYYYKNVLPSICQFAFDKGLDIHILPHINTDYEKEFNKKTKQLLEEINPNVKVIIKSLNNCFDYEKNIREAKIVLGMRYHTTVFACKNAVPFVGLAYEQKMLEVAKYSEQEKSVINLNSVDEGADILSVLNYTWNNKETIEDKLEEKSKELIEKSLIVMKENFDFGYEEWKQ